MGYQERLVKKVADNLPFLILSIFGPDETYPFELRRYMQFSPVSMFKNAI